MYLLELVDTIRVREEGKCKNCNKETEFYDISLESFVCSIKCAQDLMNKGIKNECFQESIEDFIERTIKEL